MVLAAESVDMAAAWVLLLAGRIYVSTINIPDLDLPELIAAFNTFDDEGANVISLGDTLQVAEALGSRTTMQELVSLISKLGLILNLHCTLNIAHFMEVVSHIPPSSRGIEGRLRDAFHQLDEDGTGSISRAALAELLMHRGLGEMTDEERGKFLQDADIDQDGRIDFEEFIEANRKLLGLPRKTKALPKELVAAAAAPPAN
mmetsp:Transcript_63725/g.142129  ORF Transcript_63725/g.142129 Transcript_63725/m.142129 type:complete len:202 (+) Transcript_63725:752-1357(+)